MPPAQSKKAKEKEQKKTIEDKTFGLKNKNRSAKVQAYVKQVTQNVKCGNPNDRKKQAEYEQKKQTKEEKKKFEAEMAALFKTVDGPSHHQDPNHEEDEDKNLGVNPEEYLWTADDFEAVDEDNTRLEEKLETEREALKGRTDLTPVTEESFQAWKEKKRLEAIEAEKKRKQKAKETGGLRGRDLWEENQDLFVDDDEADDFYERESSDDEETKEAVKAQGGIKVFSG